jgi:hypothetical protein
VVVLDWWRLATDGAPNDSTSTRERLLGLLTRHIEKMHDDGRLHRAASRLEECAGVVA